jgi:hypothetical protein
MSQRIRPHKNSVRPVAELELFTGDEQRSPSDAPPPRRSGPVLPPPPLPFSLRQTGRVVTGRISDADYLWLKSSKFGVGQIIREFVSHHRGDLRAQKLRELQHELELRTSALAAARSLEEKRLADREGSHQDLERRSRAIEQLRSDFQRYTESSRTSWDHQVNWTRSRIQRIRELRNMDPRDVLDQLLESVKT